ncbi:hybrid sensor histidine kinase/response regulator [Azospirillum baldaniorum]|uniref:histidine kinase n=1 Tax=Azospirillum baldaniorum TaxID=1064539 RepID=A0A9P1JS26_9PROT|nr:PAS domain S-box protein [Azospirillum baldaniorum]AWJ89439.1 hybrid sensor histidine kinase/response regulator [Azospirillum baldaniorum]TWA81040.1 PAS domain S-box-containing protein [Azospirillum brasilense]CCC98679.1 sensor protein [Azospirillum baldaniorum]
MNGFRNERLRKRAEQALNSGGFEGAEVSATTLKEVLHELYVHQAELEIQNEELRTAQQALEASRIQYLQLFQSVPLACFTVNAAGIICEANVAAERQFGLPLRRLKGRPLTLMVESLDHGRLFTALARLRDSGQWTRQEYAFVGAHSAIDGLTDARVVELEAGPDGVDKGDVLLTITDVTERNAWVSELQDARDEAERTRAAYHHILQAVADGICGLDARGAVTFVNAAAQSMTGFGASELVGRSFAALIGGDAEEEGRRALTLSLADGLVRQVGDGRLRRQGGEDFVAELTVSPILQNGAITGAVVAFRDVTARRAAEQALAESERRHRTLVQSLSEGLVMRSGDGTVMVANAMAERLMAGPAGVLLDPIARPFESRKPGDRAGRAARRRFIGADGARLTGLPPAAKAVDSGKPVIEQIVGIAEGDEAAAPTRWLRVSSHPVPGPDGQPEAVVSSVTDISAIKSMERDLNVALDAKERFMAAASHDLRQPAQALTLLSGILLKEPIPEDARRIATQLRDTVASLGGLLDCLLDISKLEAGLVTPHSAPVEVGSIMERLHGEFRAVAASSGLTLRTVPVRLGVCTDGGLLERVLRNLLTNAIRYTRQGRVLFGARRRGGALRFEVWDTGIGIPESQIDRIFQDFYQIGNVARDRREGLGMGLSIARRLVHMLGGTIEVTSAPGKGSCFAVTLPQGAILDERHCGDSPDDSAAGSGEVDGDASVLLVEDDAVIRMALALMLDGWGYRVTEAGSVAEALELVDGTLAPDLVLTDYRLPDGDTGLMLMDTLRRRFGPDLPGVLLTGDTSSDRLREAAGAQCALLHKPIQPDDLRRTVRASLEHRDVETEAT